MSKELRTFNYYGLGKEHTCPVCGRKFLVPYSPREGGGSKWVYQFRKGNKKIYVCRYNCYRQANGNGKRKAAI